MLSRRKSEPAYAKMHLPVRSFLHFKGISIDAAKAASFTKSLRPSQQWLCQKDTVVVFCVAMGQKAGGGEAECRHGVVVAPSVGAKRPQCFAVIGDRPAVAGKTRRTDDIFQIAVPLCARMLFGQAQQWIKPTVYGKTALVVVSEIFNAQAGISVEFRAQDPPAGRAVLLQIPADQPCQQGAVLR